MRQRGPCGKDGEEHTRKREQPVRGQECAWSVGEQPERSTHREGGGEQEKVKTQRRQRGGLCVALVKIWLLLSGN